MSHSLTQNLCLFGAHRYLYRLFPSFCFGEATAELLVRTSPTANFGKTLGRWDFDVVGRPFLFMMWETFVYFGLTLLVEFFQLNSEALPWKRPPQIAYQQFDDDDSDVIDERRRIESLPLRSCPSLFFGL